MIINKNSIFHNKALLKPIATGTGLIAFDIIINGNIEQNPIYMAGGSCGNVLTILSYFGWDTYPIGRFKNNAFSQFIIKDMNRWGVNTSLLKFDAKATTPIIIERLKQNGNDIPSHSFSFFCPECHSFLPRYRPITMRFMNSIIEKIPCSKICYIDRISSGSLKLAEFCKENGSILFFEPTKITEDKKFYRFLEISDILKYSNDNDVVDPEIIEGVDIPLKIETRGSSGLIFSLNKNDKSKPSWRKMNAFPVDSIVDTAGAGDWCSAGIINSLISGNIDNSKIFDEKNIKKALIAGQALGALNCKFLGARGSMYALTKEELSEFFYQILNKKNGLIVRDLLNFKKSKQFRGKCPICLQT